MKQGKITTLIVEDEQPARERLRSMLDEITHLSVVDHAANGHEALERINSLHPDLVFLDVQMPGMNGFEVLQRAEFVPFVIFTTAYDEYAIDAFDVHALDYLLKPYRKERLIKAVDRAIASIVGHEQRPSWETEAGKLAALLSEYRPTSGYLDRISVLKGYSFHVIPIDEVDFFKAENGLVFVYRQDEHFVVDQSLNRLEEELDPTKFLRIHRNAIVNVTHIDRITPWGQGQLAVTFQNGDRLFVSRRHIGEFRRRMGLRL